jgi:uncharacterized protein YndB with AHSA1/START domain
VPAGFVTTTNFMEVRARGERRFEMQHAQRGALQERIVYLEVNEPERLVMDHSAVDGSGGSLSAITLRAA